MVGRKYGVVENRKGRKVNVSGVKDFVYEWNLMFPLDRWFRERHKVFFNSKEHREILVESIAFEFEEFKLFEEIREQQESQEYIPNKGDFMNTIEDKRTEEEKIKDSIEEFKKLDLSKFDD